ncbi:MAG: hypothetical protein IJ774_05615 [Selenomonadaceae bacterium]|nr:hypothetical protein [Selenomonadaceae bacterium]
MAFVIKSYGSGALGDVTEVTETVNSYARVTAISATTITINPTTQIDGTATFTAGAKVLVHVSASTGTSYKTYLGGYLLTTIVSVSGSTLTIADDFTAVLPTSEFEHYYVQAIAVGEYQNLTLNTGTSITPPVYSASSFVGGIVAIMCTDTLKFNGGNINLNDRGIPVASKTLRPTTNNDPAKDVDAYSGWENSDTHIHFMLNAGDGAAFIIAKKMECHEDSRIGNIAKYGVQFYRGSSDSVTYYESAPSGVTNVGGSTILIAADTIENFTPKIIAKYRTSSSTAGQGICRCYIASETKLRNDEGLYAYDCISNPSRIKKINFRGFGNGSVGDATNITTQLNNYATITAINGHKITYTAQTTAGLAQIQAGALVMIHFNQKGNTNVEHAGRFVLANVLADNGTVLTVDADIPDISVTDYAAQIVSIPQFNNFTLSTTNSATPKFSGTQGGICAIAVKGNCDLSDGKIYTVINRSSPAYAREGLAVIGNAQDSDKLPIGQGYGSILILANNLTMNTSTRIGKSYPGAASGRRYLGVKNDSTTSNAYCGSGAKAGVRSTTIFGGYGSASTKTSSFSASSQGAHVMIVADTISGLNQSAISTGGNPYGGAGYGGDGDNGNLNTSVWEHGGYNGGGAGSYQTGSSSGWAFVYCNNVINQDTTATILEN